jgi:hypothetical protein
MKISNLTKNDCLLIKRELFDDISQIFNYQDIL